MPLLSSLSTRILTGQGISTVSPVVPQLLATFDQISLSPQGGSYVGAQDFGFPNNMIQLVAAISSDPGTFGGTYDPKLEGIFQAIHDALKVGSSFNFAYYNNNGEFVRRANLTLTSKTIGTNAQGRPQLSLYTEQNLHTGRSIADQLIRDRSSYALTVSINPSNQPPARGDYLDGGFYIGDSAWFNPNTGQSGSYRLVVAPAYTETTLQLKTTNTFTSGVDNLSDGLGNTNSMNNADHPAAQYVRSLNTGGFTDWYLPSYNEAVFVLNIHNSSLPLTQRLSNRFYWQSYTNSNEQGRIFNPVTPSQGNTVKINNLGVRAVRRVPF